MSGSEEHDRVALVSVDNQATIGGLVNNNVLDIEFTASQMLLETALRVLRRVAQYTEPGSIIQMVCHHPAQIIASQKQMTDRQAQQFLPFRCNHTEMKTSIRCLMTEQDKARGRPAALVTDKELWEQFAVMTRDAQQSGEELCSLRTQLANALMFADRVAPALPEALEDGGRKIPDSPGIPGWDRTQLRGWIAQMRIAIRHKPASFPNEQWKMWYTFDRGSGGILGGILPHVQQNGDIEL